MSKAKGVLGSASNNAYVFYIKTLLTLFIWKSLHSTKKNTAIPRKFLWDKNSEKGAFSLILWKSMESLKPKLELRAEAT